MSKPISDIRLYQSHVPNTDGHPHSSPLGGSSATIAARRIALKLRERGFSLGDFDHLYLNFTSCLAEGEVRLAQRSVDRELRWFRYVDIGFSDVLSLDDQQIISMIEQALLLFAADESAIQTVQSSISEALSQGENMLVRFKEKQTASGTAMIFLRILDNGLYHPLLQVHASDGTERLRADLPPCLELHALGEISLSRNRVTIKPRKNVFAAGLSPLIFPLSSTAVPDES